MTTILSWNFDKFGLILLEKSLKARKADISLKHMKEMFQMLCLMFDVQVRSNRSVTWVTHS